MAATTEVAEQPVEAPVENAAIEANDSDEFEFGKFDQESQESNPALESETDVTKESKEDAPSSKEGPPSEPAEPIQESKSVSSPTNGATVEITSKVEAQVCEAFFEWTDSWNSGNLFGFLDAYWVSEETRYTSEMLLNTSYSKGSIVICGRKEIDKVFTDMFVKNKKRQEKYKQKKGVAGIMSLRKIIVTPTGSKDAVVYGERQMEVAGDKRGAANGIVFTVHVRKIAGNW
eukprot:CAMPEP_0172451984 /NCGR_PEP_ID=MMETSP1065-20121228/9775_1 /TAXON_ID=265537 /ORGANISM="Amphiprora paludosa, Strain CCMP125" /LENGTH=230 /DNA_ID=CAMNT_0013203957 /DNA_START=74 /DNA_END=763 /DNA_ORIENTATION=+